MTGEDFAFFHWHCFKWSGLLTCSRSRYHRDDIRTCATLWRLNRRR